MSTLRPLHAGLAASLTIGSINMLCALITRFWYDLMPLLFGAWWHRIEVYPLIMDAPDFYPPRLIGGMLLLMTLGFVAGYGYAWFYNKLAALWQPPELPPL